MTQEQSSKTSAKAARIHSEPVVGALEALFDRGASLLGALGIFLVAGVIVAAFCTWAFSEIAETVMAGGTQGFDENILRWLHARHTHALDAAMIEITALGTGTVVLMIVCVAALFLTLTKHKYSAMLLLVATAGGILLDLILKLRFDRPRPHVFEWGTNAVSSSFPSGHAMSATIVYSTVAYLAARLQTRVWARWATMLLAVILIFLICLSRLYLGVHYPSDVIAGVVIGLAWAGFCMATLEAMQKFSRRRAPESIKDELPAPQ
ncbi:MAG TPA: phosphatase PAP2 family protein [Gemmatimonadaceae bacterium]|nr:phosphatase PAP2 family protein [Gemmatimonadaceae bacterium]